MTDREPTAAAGLVAPIAAAIATALRCARAGNLDTTLAALVAVRDSSTSTIAALRAMRRLERAGDHEGRHRA